MSRIVIIGGGSWGLALGNVLFENKHSVTIWEYRADSVDLIHATGQQGQLLPGIDILPSITSHAEEVMAEPIDILLFAIPSQFLRPTCSTFSPWLSFHPEIKAVVNVAKGIEKGSLLRMSEVLQQELPSAVHSQICTLSGPSHAEEVSRKIPTAVVVAGSNPDALQLIQSTFSNETFRVYRSSDLIGVELGGSVKNIISIAAGIVEGLGFGDNTIGALLTRGVAELKRLGVKLGAKPETFLGLSGMGDLITTATSKHSRNRYVGYEIGTGKKLAAILDSMVMVAEGVDTTQSVYDLSRKLEIEMPITEQIYQVLFQDKDPKLAIRELMTRDLKQED